MGDRLGIPGAVDFLILFKAYFIHVNVDISFFQLVQVYACTRDRYVDKFNYLISGIEACTINNGEHNFAIIHGWWDPAWEYRPGACRPAVRIYGLFNLVQSVFHSLNIIIMIIVSTSIFRFFELKKQVYVTISCRDRLESRSC